MASVSEDTKAAIREAYSVLGASQRECSKTYSVGLGTVNRLVKGLTRGASAGRTQALPAVPVAPPPPQDKSQQTRGPVEVADTEEEFPDTPLGAAREQLRDICQDIKAARKRSVFSPLASLHAQRRKLQLEVEALESAETDPADEMSDEDLVGFIETALEDLPPALRQRLAGSLEAMEAGAVIDLADRRKEG